MNAPCAIEYILVTRWRGGKKGGQNRVCACDTRDRGVNKKLKPEHPSETVVMPESGERKRNLTTVFCFCLCLVCFESRRQPLRLVEALDSLVLNLRVFTGNVSQKKYTT